MTGRESHERKWTHFRNGKETNTEKKGEKARAEERSKRERERRERLKRDREISASSRPANTRKIK